jgi:hypothetical protein
MTRCVAVHRVTGERCRRHVSIQPQLQTLKLCREHGKSPTIVLEASMTPPQERDALARGTWTNAREIGR